MSRHFRTNLSVRPALHADARQNAVAQRRHRRPGGRSQPLQQRYHHRRIRDDLAHVRAAQQRLKSLIRRPRVTPNALACTRENLDNPPRSTPGIAIEQLPAIAASSTWVPAVVTEVKTARHVSRLRSIAKRNECWSEYGVVPVLTTIRSCPRRKLTNVGQPVAQQARFGWFQRFGPPPLLPPGGNQRTVSRDGLRGAGRGPRLPRRPPRRATRV
jgi:hypothetical protein